MEYTPPSSATSLHDQHSLGAINRWSWYPGDNLVLRSGFDYRFISLDSTEIGNRHRHDGGIYAAAEYKPVQQFLVIPSIKAVFSSAGQGGGTLVPKLGLAWNVTDSLTLRNNYFRSFKFPDFEELYWTGGGGTGNPDLRPEDGWGGDIGASWNINNVITIENVFFAQMIQDSIHWYSGAGGTWQPENVGKAAFFGLDTRVNFKIPLSIGPIKKITPSLSYKFLRSYLLGFGYTFASDKRIPYNPQHTIGGSLDISWGSNPANRGSLLISGHYESVRYADRANLTGLEPYFLLNATVNQNFVHNISVFGSLRNILNKSYESFNGYPMPGITLTIGMRIQFDVN
jgi:vitamin B12 transporter